jgi:methyl-accepting chemotaxis protein
MSMIKNWKIGTRLGLGFGAMVVLMICAVGFGLERIETLRKISGRLATTEAEKLALTESWVRAIESNTARTWVVFFSTDAAAIAKVKSEMQGTIARTTEGLKRIQELATSPEDKKMLEEISRFRDAYQAQRSQLLKRKEAGEKVSAEVVEKLFPTAQSYFDTVLKMAALQQKSMAATQAEVEAAALQGKIALGVGSALALLTAIVIAWTLTRSITRSVNSAKDAAERIASGDLTREIVTDSRDEIGDMVAAMARMQNALRKLVEDIRGSAESIKVASSEVAMGNTDLSARTESQASSLQQTAASVEQLTGTVKQSADNARQAQQLAATASEVAAKGGAVVGEVVTTMDSITEASKKISDIIGVIDGIAFQTNILALNAAVEAARAGEQGRGFAVVAGEVRTLAQRSAQAAKEIKTLIGDSVSKVDAGSRLVADAGSTMDEIVSQVKRVTDLIGEITAATIEQSGGIEQVNTAVVSLDQTTQQNAALVEQSAAAAASLKDQATKLNEAVGLFKVAG